MSALENMAKAISAAQGVTTTSEMETARSMAIARKALESLKDLDEGTVEAMKVGFTKALMSDGPRNGHTSAFTAAIDHILKAGEP